MQKLKWVLISTELYDMAVNDFDARKSARYHRMFVMTKLAACGTKCMELPCTVQSHISTTRVNVSFIGTVPIVF